MKIGIFDSGLGGLIVTKAITSHLPHYDYLYLGDTLHCPYGNRSSDAIYDLTRKAVSYLFEQDCQLIILACNTASVRVLRRLQQEYLPKTYPNRRILGVVIPAVEEAIESGHKKIGLLATQTTVDSNAYPEEINKIRKDAKIIKQSAPLLVPMIENNELDLSTPILTRYITPLKDKKIDALLLGCTHYPYLKPQIKALLGEDIHLISQDEFIPLKLADYLDRHPEIECTLSKTGKQHFQVTDLTPNYQKMAKTLYGQDITIEKIEL